MSCALVLTNTTVIILLGMHSVLKAAKSVQCPPACCQHVCKAAVPFIRNLPPCRGATNLLYCNLRIFSFTARTRSPAKIAKIFQTLQLFLLILFGGSLAKHHAFEMKRHFGLLQGFCSQTLRSRDALHNPQQPLKLPGNGEVVQLRSTATRSFQPQQKKSKDGAHQKT